MKKVYITSTLHHEFNLAFNPKLCAAIEARGIACFLPQRDTNQQGTSEEKYTNNIAGMDQADIILCVAKNETPNWGAEVAYAYARGKKVVAITEEGHNPPVMTAPMMARVITVKNVEEIPSYLDELIASL